MPETKLSTLLDKSFFNGDDTIAVRGDGCVIMAARGDGRSLGDTETDASGVEKRGQAEREDGERLVNGSRGHAMPPLIDCRVRQVGIQSGIAVWYPALALSH